LCAEFDRTHVVQKALKSAEQTHPLNNTGGCQKIAEDMMFALQFLKILPFGQDFPFCKSSSHILQDYVQEPSPN